MLYIHVWNSLEKLVSVMSDNMSGSKAPLKKATVCVQTSGMQRWVALALARQSGIAANLDFLFPAALIKRLAELSTGRKNLWTEKETLVWLVFNNLLHLPPRPAFSVIREYLDGDTDSIKTFRLALRVADVFDQYQLYRPDMVLRWLDGAKELSGDELWQAELFRSVFKDRSVCKTQVLDDLIKTLASGDGHNMPDTLHLFGLSVIPPFFIDVLNAASAYTDIHLYLLSPTAHYFGDSKTDREIRRMEIRSGKTAEELGIWQNHPLLDNLGVIGRDFFINLLEKTEYNDISGYDPIEPDTLLNAVKYEILQMEHLDDFHPKEGDNSITIAGCHNPLREAEELYDYLLNLFNNDKTLKPSDVLVMTPDIRSLAPYIRSVFDNPYSPETTIPYTLADLPQKTDNAPAGVFTSLVDALTGQFSLSALVRLLDSDILAEKAGIKDTGFIASLLDRNGGYWGLDSAELAEDGVTSDTCFTFDRAMRRLALGLAEGGSQSIYSEAAGNGVPFGRAEEIGGLMRFTELCADYRKKLKEKHTPAQWCDMMTEMIDVFMADSQQYADDTVYLIKRISMIKDSSSSLDEPIDFRPVYETLQTALDEARGAKGFMSGRVTFCAMLPMRSIPFRVICVLGLDDSTFPRIKTSLEFDLIAAHPKRGDRTQRDSDKYLFLETLISAQEKLYLSYKSRSETDNRSLVPSILITELKRYLETSLHAGELLTEHRLHSFSRRYFKNEKGLFTYSPERYRAAQAMTARGEKTKFCEAELNTEPPVDVTLAEFERFFTDPPKFFLERTLGVDADRYADLLPETEKMTMDYLDRYNLRTSSLDAMMNSGTADRLLRYERMTAQMPTGGVGDACETDIKDYVTRSYDLIKDYTGDGDNMLDVKAEAAGLTITGRIANRSGDKWLYVKAGSIKAKDFMRIWVRHAVINSFMPMQSHILTGDGIIIIEPFDTKNLLAAMAETYIKGLRTPFSFHPADCIKMLKPTIKELKFIGDDNYSSAETDQSFMICFGGKPDYEVMLTNAKTLLSQAEDKISGGEE